MASFAFDDAYYAQQRPDVVQAINEGRYLGSLYDHFNEYGQSEGTAPSAAATQYQGGVRDISMEPLHQWEKAGLTSLAGTGEQAAQQYQQGAQTLSSLAQRPTINPLSQPAFEAMRGAIDTGTQRMTQADIDRYMNPYQSQVIDRMTQNLTEQGQKAMAKLQAQDVGRSAGSSSRAIQQGQLTGDLMDTLGNQQSNLLYQGFADALGQFNTEQNRYLTAANQYGNLGAGAQGVTASGAQTGLQVGGGLTSLGMQGIQNQIGAGGAVRDYNQALVDRTAGALTGQQQYSGNQLTNLLNQINSIQGGSNVQNYTEPSTLGRIGAGLSGLGDIAGSFGGGAPQQSGYGVYSQQGSLPWQTAGATFPTWSF